MTANHWSSLTGEVKPPQKAKGRIHVIADDIDPQTRKKASRGGRKVIVTPDQKPPRRVHRAAIVKPGTMPRRLERKA